MSGRREGVRRRRKEERRFPLNDRCGRREAAGARKRPPKCRGTGWLKKGGLPPLRDHAPGCPAWLADFVDGCCRVRAVDRPADAGKALAALRAARSAAEASAGTPKVVPPSHPVQKGGAPVIRKRRAAARISWSRVPAVLSLVIALAVFLFGVGFLVWLWLHPQAFRPAPPAKVVIPPPIEVAPTDVEEVEPPPSPTPNEAPTEPPEDTAPTPPQPSPPRVTPPKPPRPPVTVRVTGNARQVVLRSGKGSTVTCPGQGTCRVAPGSYSVTADFGSGSVPQVGTLSALSDTVTLDCDKGFLRCTW